MSHKRPVSAKQPQQPPAQTASPQSVAANGVNSEPAGPANHEQTCPQCGTAVRPGMIRCRDCGQILRGATPVAAKSTPNQESHDTTTQPTDTPQPRTPAAAPNTNTQQPTSTPAAPLREIAPAKESLESESTNSATTAPSANETATTSAASQASTTKRRFPWKTPTTRLGRVVSRARWQHAGIALAIGVLGIGLVLAGMWFNQERRADEFVRAYASPTPGLTNIAIDPAGSFLVAGAATGEVIMWNIDSSQPRPLERLTEAPIISLAISRDGFLVAGDADQHLLGWQLGDTQTNTFPRFLAPIACIAFRPVESGAFEVALGLADGTLVLLDQSGGEKLPSAGTAGIKSLAFDPQGTLLVAGTANGRIVWWDAAKRKRLGAKSGHTSEVSGLAFSPNGRRLASGCWDGQIRVWDATTRASLAELQQPAAIAQLQIADNKIITAGWDGILRFLALDNPVIVQEINTGQVIHDLVITPDGKTAFTISDRQQVDEWRLP